MKAIFLLTALALVWTTAQTGSRMSDRAKAARSLRLSLRRARAAAATSLR